MTTPSSAKVVGELVTKAKNATHLRLLLDYDGTLVPFFAHPDGAIPDTELKALLGALSTCKKTSVWIVTGRPRTIMERWLGALSIGFVAEHGLWVRPPGSAWSMTRPIDKAAVEALRPELVKLAKGLAGAAVEEKSAGFAFHYRRVNPQPTTAQLDRLRSTIAGLGDARGLTVLDGDGVIELRPKGVHKGLAWQLAGANAAAGSLAIACGDDVTDLDLFEHKVGEAVTVAASARVEGDVRVDGPKAMRALLHDVARARGAII